MGETGKFGAIMGETGKFGAIMGETGKFGAFHRKFLSGFRN